MFASKPLSGATVSNLTGISLKYKGGGKRAILYAHGYNDASLIFASKAWSGATNGNPS